MKRLEISTAVLAKLCGVSQGTVDRALNNRSDINAETKRKILQTAKQYGYRREQVPSSGDEIAAQVGIVVFNLNNEYFSKLIMEIEHVLRECGCCATVMMTHYDQRREAECVRELYNIGVTGIVLCSVNGDEIFKNYLKLFDIPIVAVGNNIGGIPYVGIDDFSAMSDMTRKVKADGIEKIVYFSPALRYPNAFAQRLRYEGFLSAVGSTPFEVVTSIDEIRESYSEKTAIMCSNDYYALQVYSRVKNKKITGFDNLDIIGNCGFPIDSVDYSAAETAQHAVDIIMKKENIGKTIAYRIIEQKHA